MHPVMKLLESVREKPCERVLPPQGNQTINQSSGWHVRGGREGNCAAGIESESGDSHLVYLFSIPPSRPTW